MPTMNIQISSIFLLRTFVTERVNIAVRSAFLAIKEKRLKMT